MIRWWAIGVVGLVTACNGGTPREPEVAAEPEPAVEEPVPTPVSEPALGDVPDVVALPVAGPEPVKDPGEDAPGGDGGVAGPPDPGPPPPLSASQEAYAQCRDRVELPEADGECKTSADCGSSGCGGELCVARSHGTMMSTCEVRACFAVLDTCGCVSGRCVWSVKDEAPPLRQVILPP